MFGIPMWVISLIITILKNVGAVSWAKSLTIRYGLEAIHFIGELKTYDEYPNDQPIGTPNNLNKE